MNQEKSMRQRIFQNNLKNSMKDQGFTQSGLAEKCGVTQAAVSRWLNGAIPQADQLHGASIALGVSMEWLLTGQAGDAPQDPERLKFRQPDAPAIRKALAAMEKALANLKNELEP